MSLARQGRRECFYVADAKESPRSRLRAAQTIVSLGLLFGLEAVEMRDGLTLYGALKKSALAYKNDTALVYFNKKITYARLFAEVDSVAAWFCRRGVRKGDAVTLCMPNVPQVVTCFYALNKIGAIACMINPLAPTKQLAEFMSVMRSKFLVIPDTKAAEHSWLIDSGVQVLLCSISSHLGFFARNLYALRKFRSLPDVSGKVNVFNYSDAMHALPRCKDECADCDAAAVYIHGGGTSEKQKAIVLSSASINACCQDVFSSLRIEKTDFRRGGMLSALPAFYSFGLVIGIHLCLTLGARDVMIPSFNVSDVINNIKNGNATYVIGVPTMYEALLRDESFSGKNVSGLRFAFAGGDFVSERLVHAFNERMEAANARAELLVGYGLTETVSICTLNTAYANRLGSVGRALDNVTVEAFDGNKMLPRGRQGELCVAGDELMRGYFGDGVATASAFFVADGKKFVRTGDIGVVDEDGFVFFRARIKRIIKVNGVSVFPSEIERLCSEECPEVDEAYVVGTADERLGSKIILFLSTKTWMNESEREYLEERVVSLIESRLSVYASPSKIYFVKELPKTDIGKIDVNKLKEIYQIR